MSLPSYAFSTAARTHVGRVRQLNEDSYVARPDIGLWAVADGMGGHERGDEASRLIAARLEALSPPDSAPSLPAHGRGRRAGLRPGGRRLARGHQRQHARGAARLRRPLRPPLGGHSRAYRLREGRLDRLTEDHSLVQELVAAGELTPEAARQHPYRNRITRAVGVGHGLELARLQGELAAGDLFLLCSDGLTGELGDGEIASLLAGDAPDAAADRLVARALEAGGQDNITLRPGRRDAGRPGPRRDGTPRAGRVRNAAGPAVSPGAPAESRAVPSTARPTGYMWCTGSPASSAGESGPMAQETATDLPFAGLRARFERVWPYLAPCLGLALFVGAIWAIRRELGQWQLADIARALAGMPVRHLVLAVLAAAGAYLVLAFYDTVALRHLERPLPLRRSLLAGFVGYAFSHAIGIPLVTGGAVRFRLYSAWGLSAAEIAGVVAFNGVTLWLGVGAMLALGGLAGPDKVGHLLGIGEGAVRAVALVLVLLLAAYPLLPSLVGPRVTVGRWSAALPSPGVALVQLGMAVLDWSLSALCLWVLLPGSVGVNFLTFASLFSVACLAGVVSHLPAGIGVFEAVLLLALPGAHAEPKVAAALIAFRLVFFVLPVVAATALFAWYQLRSAGAVARERVGVVLDWAHVVVPNLLFVLVFVGGVILLVSGATPAWPPASPVIAPMAPLAVIELSHFLGSLTGLALVLLALGLRRRLDAAYVASVGRWAPGSCSRCCGASSGRRHSTSPSSWPCCCPAVAPSTGAAR